MKTRLLLALLALAGLSIAAPIPIAELRRSEPVDFARDIYPILKRNCLACHNTTKAKADLNLESPELMRKGGEDGPVIVAGKSGESLLLKSAAHLDEDLIMPPPGNKVKATDLTPEELAMLKLWIDQGAPGESVAMAKGPLPWRAPPVDAAVNAVAISPDGRVAAAARGNRVQLCELPTGRVIAHLDDPALEKRDVSRNHPATDLDAVMSVAFASDDLLATGGFRTVRLWRRAPRAVRRDFGVLAEAATVLAVSPDGQWAAAGDGKGGVSVWSLTAEKFEPIQLKKEHGGAVTALVFAPDNATLVSAADDKSVAVWIVSNGALAFKAQSPATIRALAFLDSGAEIIAGCADGVVRIWQWLKEPPPELPPPVREFKIQEGPVNALAATRDAAFVWASADGSLRWANANDGKEQRKIVLEHPAARDAARLETEMQIAQGLAATRKAQLTASAEQLKKESENARTAAQVLEKARAESRRKKEESDVAADAQREMPEDKSLKDAVQKAADAFTKTETAYRAVKSNAELGARLVGEAASVQARAEAALASAEAAVVEAQSGLDAARKIVAQPAPATAQFFLCSDGASALLTDAAGSMHRVSAESGTRLESPERTGLIAMMPTGDLLCVSTDKHVRLRSAARAWVLERVIGDADDPSVLADRVTAVAFSPNGNLLATGGGTPSRDGELKFWRVADGTLARQVPNAHTDTINALAFSPDGELLATAASDRLARVWRVSDGTRVANLEGHSGHVLGLAWRADGLALATGGADRTVRIWDVATGKQTKSTANFGGEIAALSFVGAGELLLAASGDKSLRLGDQALPDAAGYPFCVASDMTGRIVAMGAHDGVLRVWSVSDRKLLRTFAAAQP